MNDDAAYQATLDYLYTFVDYSIQRNFKQSPETFDLSRMKAMMAELGRPEQSYPMIHVAGTKGKGSVTAMCASALQAAGYRVGCYTSPHLQDYGERIQVNGQPIARRELVMLVEELKPYINAIPRITTFEITTALAFLYFARRNVNAAVIEVGLGGRLDATNVIVPKVSVITSLSYDHTSVLGDTISQIATEKAGIIKTEVPVALAPQIEDEARLVIRRIANERHAPLIEVGRDYLYAPLSRSLDGQSFLVWSRAEQAQVDAYIESGGRREWEPTRLTIPLLGMHQVENAATAYAALQMAHSVGLKVMDKAIRRGFAQVQWPARFEILRRKPPLVVDSAHNRDSALRLRLALDDYFNGMPVVMVFGASEDKDIRGMFTELLPRVQRVIVTKSIHPRAMQPDLLVEMAHQFGRPAKVAATVEEALEQALQMAGDEALVLATGSLFVAAGIRMAWQRLQEIGSEA